MEDIYKPSFPWCWVNACQSRLFFVHFGDSWCRSAANGKGHQRVSSRQVPFTEHPEEPSSSDPGSVLSKCTSRLKITHWNHWIPILGSKGACRKSLPTRPWKSSSTRRGSTKKTHRNLWTPDVLPVFSRDVLPVLQIRLDDKLEQAADDNRCILRKPIAASSNGMDEAKRPVESGSCGTKICCFFLK